MTMPSSNRYFVSGKKQDIIVISTPLTIEAIDPKKSIVIIFHAFMMYNSIVESLPSYQSLKEKLGFDKSFK